MTQYNFIVSNIELNTFSYGVRNEGSHYFIDWDDYLKIFSDELFGDLLPYTNGPNIMGIDFGRKYLEKPDQLLNYIKSTLDNQNVIEIFSVWLGEKNEVEKKSCHIDELDEERIKWVFSYEGFKNPRKLKIYKYIRGKK